MAYLFNDPTRFAEELVEGFVASHRTWVSRVPGGVIRSTASTPGQVAVIIGGGSGHYPAFAGLVGDGIAHGAAMGNLFASPSAQQIYSVAKAANAGGGILLSYGNYAGDVLNFDQAQERLLAEGIPCRTVVVTDDISSAPADQRAKRRGIAGGLVVFKVAGAAAEAGADLDEVARVAALANERTRSLGVAFTGCTLPGSTEPLFTVPAGRMALGMGIHGEPGISELDIPSADAVAELFVTELLAEAPEQPGSRLGVILNGLGSVKNEELFVVYRRIEQLVGERSLSIVDPEVGEMVTSFEMAGTSLTLCWLDDELAAYWQAPANTPAFRKGALAQREQRAEATAPAATVLESVPESTEASRQAAATVLRLLEATRRTIEENVDELGRLDSIAGDGDHGIGMNRGARAAAEAARAALAQGAGAATLLERAGDAWADKAGGTSGALWGIALRAVGSRFGDDAAPDARAVADGIRAATAEIMRFGKATPGDKTLVDVLAPFSDALGGAVADGVGLATAWAAASAVADAAADATVAMVPKLGRARPLAEKSVGTADPGAVSLAMIIRTINGELADTQEKGRDHD